MGPVAIDRRASSSLAELIASMSEDELGTAVTEAAPQLPVISGSFAMPPAGDLTSASPPTPEASAYGYSRGSVARRRVASACGFERACLCPWPGADLRLYVWVSSEGHAKGQPLQVFGCDVALQNARCRPVPRATGHFSQEPLHDPICWRRSLFVSPFASTAPLAADSPRATDGGVGPLAAAEAAEAAASSAQLAAASGRDVGSGAVMMRDPRAGSLGVAAAAEPAVSEASEPVPSATEVNADGRWDVSPAADAVRRRSAVRPLPSPFADPVSSLSASLQGPQHDLQLRRYEMPTQDLQPKLQLASAPELHLGARPEPPIARLDAMVAAAIGAHGGSGAGSDDRGKRSLRRASGSTGSMPTAPAGVPPRGPVRRTRSTTARVTATGPQPRRSTSGSPTFGASGPLGAPSRSSEDSGKSTPATGGSLRLSDSASSYELDAAVSGLSTSSSSAAAAAAPRLPSPLRRSTLSAGHSRPLHAAPGAGVAPTPGASTPQRTPVHWRL